MKEKESPLRASKAVLSEIVLFFCFNTSETIPLFISLAVYLLLWRVLFGLSQTYSLNYYAEHFAFECVYI